MPIGSNAPFRGGKYELWEGGLRSPTIVRWPGRIEAGATVASPSMSIDWYPTLLRAGSTRRTGKLPIDGRDITASLMGHGEGSQRPLFWSFRDDLVKIPQSYACRLGRWKYLKIGETEHLFDLAQDAAEDRDRSAQQPALLRKLREEVRRWLARL